jgi:ssDNA-specific exonuclease RecJ
MLLGRIGFGFQLGFVNVEQGIETIHKEVDKRFL